MDDRPAATRHPFDLRGRVAVVTGGNAGIGLACAQGLAAAGAAVCVWGRRKEQNRAAVERLEADGGTATAQVCDVADENAVAEAFAGTVSDHGQVDVVVASAGISAVAPSSAELDTDEWRRVLAVDLDGVMFTFRQALRHLTRRRATGSLIAIGSRLSANGQPRAPHYSAAKAGLEGLVKALAREYGPAGIRANLVHPGWIETPMTRDVIAKEKVRDAVLPRMPMRRFGRPDELAGIVVYLASDASSYHTGDVIRVDGGDGLG